MRARMRGKPCHARGLPCQRAVASSMAITVGCTVVASYACLECRRTVEANQGSKVAGSKARLPCTDMPATCRPQRAVSGARGGRSAAAHAIVFGAPQTTMVRLMYSDKEGDTIRLASRRRQRGGSGAAAPISSFRRTARTARTARRAHRRIEVASPTAPRKAFLRPKDGGSGNTSVCNEDPR